MVTPLSSVVFGRCVLLLGRVSDANADANET